MMKKIRYMPATEAIELEPYPTLKRQRKALLIGVHELEIRSDGFDLIRQAVPSMGHRKLTHSHVIELVFIGDRDMPFYTLLSYEGWLTEYYKARIGLVFEVITERR